MTTQPSQITASASDPTTPARPDVFVVVFHDGFCWRAESRFSFAEAHGIARYHPSATVHRINPPEQTKDSGGSPSIPEREWEKRCHVEPPREPENEWNVDSPTRAYYLLTKPDGSHIWYKYREPRDPTRAVAGNFESGVEARFVLAHCAPPPDAEHQPRVEAKKCKHARCSREAFTDVTGNNNATYSCDDCGEEVGWGVYNASLRNQTDGTSGVDGNTGSSTEGVPARGVGASTPSPSPQSKGELKWGCRIVQATESMACLPWGVANAEGTHFLDADRKWNDGPESIVLRPRGASFATREDAIEALNDPSTPPPPDHTQPPSAPSSGQEGSKNVATAAKQSPGVERDGASNGGAPGGNLLPSDRRHSGVVAGDDPFGGDPGHPAPAGHRAAEDRQVRDDQCPRCLSATCPLVDGESHIPADHQAISHDQPAKVGAELPAGMTAIQAIKEQK